MTYAKILYYNYIMKLLHFNGKTCKHIIDIMPSVKAVAQMEQEFAPYLDVSYLTNRQHNEANTGIILQTKNGTVKRYYTFKKPEDIAELRDLIWEYLLKEKNIVELKETEQNRSDCSSTRVVQHWENIVKECDKHNYSDVNTKILPPEPESEIKSIAKVFRMNPNDKQTKQTCLKQRMQECSDNWPPETDNYRQCTDEVEWLCTNGYPNKRLLATNKYVQDSIASIFKDLEEHDGYVGKRQFDRAIDAGLYYDTGVRSGNKTRDGYDKNYDGIEYFDEDNNNKKYVILFIFIMIIIVCILKKH